MNELATFLVELSVTRWLMGVQLTYVVTITRQSLIRVTVAVDADDFFPGKFATFTLTK